MEDFKQIAITGGSGHLGTCLIDRLLSQGYSVRAQYNSYLPSISHPKLTWIQAEISDKKAIQELILNFLSGKRAVRQKELGKDIEIFIQESDDDYCGSTKPKYAISRILKKMIDDEVVEEHETDFSSFLSLTKTGRNKLRNIKLSSRNHLISTDWDGYWRIVIIDIPEERKSERDALRYVLKKAQFVQIKNSMWISPYPMEHMMIGMKEDLEMHEEIMIFVTDKLDPDTERVLGEKFIEEKKEN